MAPSPLGQTGPVDLDAAIRMVQQHPADVAARDTLAQRYLETHDRFGAVEQLEAVRELGDFPMERATRLASLYDELGEPEAAASVLKAAMEAQPDLEHRIAYSRAVLKLGRFHLAADAVRPLLNQWAALSVPRRQDLIRTLLMAGDAEAAHVALNRVRSDEERGDPEWAVLRGLCARLMGQTAEAVHQLGLAVTRNPGDAWNATLFGEACRDAGQIGGALNAWAPVVRSGDAAPEALIGAATLLAQQGRLDEADRLLARVANGDRKAPDYWRAQGLVAHARGQKTAEQAAAGYVAYNSGDPWRAEAIWAAAIPTAQDADARELCVAIFNSAFRREDPQTALRYAGLAATRWPKDTYILRSRAEFLIAENRTREALADAKRVQSIAAPGEQASAAERLSRIALDTGQQALLQESAEANRKLDPHDPLPLLHLAEWQYAQGHDPNNLQRTLDLYQQAAAIAPENAEAYARGGIVLNDMKRYEEARSMLVRALSLAPRVLEGTPNALLAQIEGRAGMPYESRFEAREYLRLRQLKDAWPNEIKALRQVSPRPSIQAWKALARTALDRHETWVALCGARRALGENPNDAEGWELYAAASRRFGWFDEALAAMRHAHLCHGA